MLMTSCFVCATLNLGRKKSTGTEPLVDCWSSFSIRRIIFFNVCPFDNMAVEVSWKVGIP